MTGEITLRGEVLPIGGLKEKTLAARTAGIRTLVVPELNRRDLEEIPAALRRGVEFVFVDHMDAVLARAFVAPPSEDPAPTGEPAATVSRVS